MLRLVQKDDLHLEWERVREGLADLKKHGSEDWILDDVYLMLNGGALALYIGEIDGEYVGFLLLQIQPMFHGKRLNIWGAYSATKTQLMARYWPDIQTIARNIGAKKIIFTSLRDEWQQAGKKLGFVPTHTQYEHELRE